MDDIALPLLGFNIGIELGQILVLAGAAALLFALDTVLERVRRASWPEAFQLRVLTVSAAVALVAGGWAVERLP